MMNLDPAVAAAEDLLREHGASEVAHPGGTLLEHLHRVRDQLSAWGVSPEVQLAGLCHACYGTDGFDVALLELAERPLLANAIGEEAEALVYLYASCDRASVYSQLDQSVVEFRDRFTRASTRPDQGALRAFVDITAANELDVVRNNSDLGVKYGPALQRLFHRASRHLTPAAADAWSGQAGPTNEQAAAAR